MTEYGIADLRGGSDAHCVMAMIAIADSRFQPEPLERAKSAGKFPKHAVVPGRHGTNTPDRVRSWLSPFVKDGSLPVFPFGTDFGEVEQRLLPTLSILKAASGSPTTMASLLWNGVVASSSAPDLRACLERLALDRPRSFRERLSRLAVKGAFAASTDAD